MSSNRIISLLACPTASAGLFGGATAGVPNARAGVTAGRLVRGDRLFPITGFTGWA